MKEGLIKDVYELVIKEVQLVLTITYLLMIGIGMLFNYHKYREFGINIFEYADVFDFLIAPFQDINILVASLVSAILPLFILWLDLLTKKKFPKFYSKMNFGWDKKPWYNRLRIVSFGLLFLYFISEGASGYGSFIENNIYDKDATKIEYIDGSEVEGQYIGKTKDIIFLLVDSKTRAIPIGSAVKEIHLK